ncbi:hypothetical protein [Klebsiella pneumoniae IS22]|nr:hypothetical protein [Klebsiella pneumoniae IS22]
MRGKPLDVTQREGKGKQHDGHHQRTPVAFDQRQCQQAANHHQQEVNGFHAHYRCQPFNGPSIWL